jgi:hypothetical protein
LKPSVIGIAVGVVAGERQLQPEPPSVPDTCPNVGSVKARVPTPKRKASKGTARSGLFWKLR